MTQYLIGSTRDDGWYLTSYRMVSGGIAYTRWTNDRNRAASFTEDERKRLPLPPSGCWVRSYQSDIMNLIVPDREFDIASEADEIVV